MNTNKEKIQLIGMILSLVILISMFPLTTLAKEYNFSSFSYSGWPEDGEIMQVGSTINNDVAYAMDIYIYKDLQDCNAYSDTNIIKRVASNGTYVMGTLDEYLSSLTFDTSNGSEIKYWVCKRIYKSSGYEGILRMYPAMGYKLSYNLNGGTGTVPVDSNKYYEGNSVTLPDGTGITKDGYTFSGWALTSDATTASSEYLMGTNNVTLYAVWTVAEEIPTTQSEETTTDIDEEDNNLDDSENSEETDNSESPKTGDSAPILPLMLCVISAGLVVLTSVTGRKKKYYKK